MTDVTAFLLHKNSDENNIAMLFSSHFSEYTKKAERNAQPSLIFTINLLLILQLLRNVCTG